jgi:hypothetical protein
MLLSFSEPRNESFSYATQPWIMWLDTVTPLQTPYWFYLTDKKGEMRFAETYEGHLNNINKYLR